MNCVSSSVKPPRRSLSTGRPAAPSRHPCAARTCSRRRKRRAEADAVEAADKLALRPGLNGVGMPIRNNPRYRSRICALIQVWSRPARVRRRRRRRLRTRYRTGCRRAPADRLAERARDVKPSSGRMPRKRRVDPMDRRVIGIFRHRKDTGRIGAQQDLGCDQRLGAVPSAARQCCVSGGLRRGGEILLQPVMS